MNRCAYCDELLDDDQVELDGDLYCSYACYEDSLEDAHIYD